MKLLRVQIHNFRGIRDAEMHLSDYSLIVGANNAGKTTFIDAIRAFYEKDGAKYRADKDAPQGAVDDKESWIDLTFGLTDEEHESLKTDYHSTEHTLRVRKYFQTELKQDNGKPRTGYIFGYTSDGKLSGELFYGAKNVQSGKFGDIIYIPAISKVDDHTKLSGPSALRDLLSGIMSDIVESGQSYPELAESIDAFSSSILRETTSDDRSLSGLEDELNALLQPWNTAFRLKFKPPTATELLKSMLDWTLADQSLDAIQTIDQFGSGFQRHFIFSLIQVGSRYRKETARGKSKDFTPSLNLLLFEEPEAFLHPPQQESLGRSLRELVRSDNWQALCTTHSPHFVSRHAADIPSIARVAKSKQDGICSFQIRNDQWDAIVGDNQEIFELLAPYSRVSKKFTQDDMTVDMESVKYFLWLNPDRCNLFFSNKVLLVEGPTEVALLSRLVGDGLLSDGIDGLYILNCMGKYNIHRFMNLLSCLGIPHLAVHDSDDDREEHHALNRLIQDSRNSQWTVGIHRINGDIERALGIPSAGSPHRKPQHVLYQYTQGNIDSAKLTDFCTFLNECIGDVKRLDAPASAAGE